MGAISRIIFQQGIDIQCDERGVWHYSAADPNIECPSPQAVIQKFGVLPILAYQRVPNHPDCLLLQPSSRNDSLGVQLTGLAQGVFEDAPAIFDALHIQNVVGAVHYHCAALAERYGNVPILYYQLWQRIPGHQMNDDRLTLQHQYELYYEFEALVSAAKRAYDATRHLLWRKFGAGNNAVPASFDRVIRNLPRLPVSLRERLERSWRTYGEGLKEYRDCIQHYVPLGGTLPYAVLSRRYSVWTIAVWIPDNPQARSTRKFTYSRKLDALEYGWAVTNEVFDIAKAILDEVRAAPKPRASMR